SQIVQQIFPTTGSTNAKGSLTLGAPIYPQINRAFVGAAGTPSIVYFAANSRMPQIDQFDMVIEHEIAPNTVISVSYLGSYGRFLPMGIDTNAPPQGGTLTYTIAGTLPVTGNSSINSQLPAVGTQFTVPYNPGGTAARPNHNFQTMAEISTSAKSWYNAGVVQLNRRMQHGLQVNTSYTYAHAIDTDQTSSALISGSTPLSPNKIAATLASTSVSAFLPRSSINHHSLPAATPTRSLTGYYRDGRLHLSRPYPQGCLSPVVSAEVPRARRLASLEQMAPGAFLLSAATASASPRSSTPISRSLAVSMCGNECSWNSRLKHSICSISST